MTENLPGTSCWGHLFLIVGFIWGFEAFQVHNSRSTVATKNKYILLFVIVHHKVSFLIRYGSECSIILTFSLQFLVTQSLMLLNHVHSLDYTTFFGWITSAFVTLQSGGGILLGWWTNLMIFQWGKNYGLGLSFGWWPNCRLSTIRIHKISMTKNPWRFAKAVLGGNWYLSAKHPRRDLFQFSWRYTGSASQGSFWERLYTIWVLPTFSTGTGAVFGAKKYVQIWLKKASWASCNSAFCCIYQKFQKVTTLTSETWARHGMYIRTYLRHEAAQLGTSMCFFLVHIFKIARPHIVVGEFQ